ncbi:MAG: hypothetical protein ABI658_02455 [Acidimicrobiales bacterium]
MKVTTSGVLRRIELTSAIDLLPALFQQWNDLQFDDTGRVVDAPAGCPIAKLLLVEGGHRQPGARYEVTMEQPIFATLTHDDSRRIVAMIGDERRRWTADVEIARERLPTIDLTLRVDTAAAASSDANPGRIDRLLGGRGAGQVRIDLRTIEGNGGTLVDARGRVNRFRISGRGDVDTDPASWDVEAALSVAGRGLGTVVMLLASRRLRRYFTGRFQQFWLTADSRITRAESALGELAQTVAREGGETAFVQRALWDPDREPRPPTSG